MVCSFTIDIYSTIILNHLKSHPINVSRKIVTESVIRSYRIENVAFVLKIITIVKRLYKRIETVPIVKGFVAFLSFDNNFIREIYHPHFSNSTTLTRLSDKSS